MATTLPPGGNAPLPTPYPKLIFTMSPIPGAEIDVSAFLVTAAGKVRSDDDMCFYGQKEVCGGALRLTRAVPGSAEFSMDLSRLPAEVEKVIFSATIHENKANFGRIPEIGIASDSGVTGVIPCKGKTETALMLAEIYRRNGQWKIRIIGQGFEGGLAALATHLGVDIEEPAPPAAPPPPRLSLSKVSLTKDQRSISLKKPAGKFGKIQVNLNWNQRPAGQGVLGGLLGPKQLDLDLGALVEDRYGNLSCVQALGESFGDFSYFPYVRLRGDDRTGAVTDGEWLDINGELWPEFNRVLVYAFIYDGAPNWQATDGVVRLLIPDQPEIEVRMNEFGASGGMCAVAMLENEGGQIKVSREVKFFPSHRFMDEHYGWGMNWVAGRK